ncbi:MAG: SDR family NAD(P)-dependent oxidoreductase [Acidobacteria bacterium]|nr:SDR family NAD(P)-dependent oxidoreductase [Acidobacteriota bacterium]
MNFQGKVVIVAGGTGALGRAASVAFLDAGAKVIATYRRQEEYDALVASAGVGAARLGGATVDVTDESAVKAFTEGVTAQHGRLDVLVNAVGGYAGGKKLWEADARTYDQMLALNLKAGWVLARAVLPAMIRRNRGWIVNVASKAAYGRSAGAALYAASKAGALALFDSLAEEVKTYNINVNSVVPSIFDTEANRQAMPGADFSKWPKPEEIAGVILFLCSEEARVVHGAAIPVYGRT